MEENDIVKKITEIFECDNSYAQKIIASIKMDLPIQGATPKQIYLGYCLISESEIISKRDFVISCLQIEKKELQSKADKMADAIENFLKDKYSYAYVRTLQHTLSLYKQK